MIVTAVVAACMATGRLQSHRPAEDIVFAAQRFDQNLGKVYSTGPTHLYAIRTDGVSFKQITSGPHYDLMPSLSRDGAHILFWRSNVEAYSWDSSLPFELYSVAMDGSDLRRLNRRYIGNLSDGLAPAFERFPNRIRTTNAEGAFSFLDGRGRPFITATDPRFNPSRNRFITYQDSDAAPDQVKRLIVDLRSQRVTTIPSRYYGPMWIGDRAIAAVLGKNNTVVLLDDHGHETMRKSLKNAVRNEKIEDEWIDEEYLFRRGRSAYLLWRKGVFLMDIHHPNSGGGYESTGEIDLNMGTYQFVGDQRVEAVSGDGLSFVGAEFEWVGGYKGAGSNRLCKLYLWDAKKLTSKPIGFRLMLCEGACFVPSK